MSEEEKAEKVWNDDDPFEIILRKITKNHMAKDSKIYDGDEAVA